MEKTEIRAVIKYFIKKGMKAKEIHANFQNPLGDSALSYSTVAKWTSEFNFGWESLDVIRIVDGQKVLLSQNLSQNGHGGSSTESARDNWSCRDAIWMGISHFNWRIGSEKIIRQIGAAALDIGP